MEYDHHYQGAFCKVCRKQEPQSLKKTGGAWITKPFKNWKKAVEKMRAHSKSDSHIKLYEVELLAARARKEDLLLYSNYKLLESKRGYKIEVVSRRFFFVPIFLHGSTFLTLLILINWLIWSCPMVVKI